MLVPFEDDTGHTAYRITNDKVPERYSFVTNADGSEIPENPETDKLMVGFYMKGEARHYALHTVDGRQGLIELVKLQGGPNNLSEFSGVPTLRMIDHCVCWILLRALSKPVEADKPACQTG